VSLCLRGAKQNSEKATSLQTLICILQHCQFIFEPVKKWIAAILLIVSVACSVVPCCMSDGCSDEELSSEGLNHENEEEGACSPFFSCTTCSGFQITKPVQISSPIIPKQQHHSQAIVFYHSGYAASFWQPPRLS